MAQNSFSDYRLRQKVKKEIIRKFQLLENITQDTWKYATSCNNIIFIRSLLAFNFLIIDK